MSMDWLQILTDAHAASLFEEAIAGAYEAGSAGEPINDRAFHARLFVVHLAELLSDRVDDQDPKHWWLGSVAPYPGPDTLPSKANAEQEQEDAIEDEDVSELLRNWWPAIRMTERESVCKGLTEAFRLLRRPTDRPDLDQREIRARIIAAADYLGRLPREEREAG